MNIPKSNATEEFYKVWANNVNPPVNFTGVCVCVCGGEEEVGRFERVMCVCVCVCVCVPGTPAGGAAIAVWWWRG